MNNSHLNNQIISDVYPLLMTRSSILFTVAQDLVSPSFNDDIETARVVFSADDSDKNIQFEFSPVFWNSLNEYEKLFVFIHEVLHVLLYHGSRGKEFMDSLPEHDRNYSTLNKAMDICINEMIMREYVDIPISMMPVLDPMMCSIRNCFPDRISEIQEQKSFNYYYHELRKNSSEDNTGFDDHDFMSASEELLELLSDVIVGAVDLDQNDVKEDSLKKSNGYSLDDKVDDVSVSVDIKSMTTSQKLEHYLNIYTVSSFGGREPRPKRETQWYGMNRRIIGKSDLMLPVQKELPRKKHRYKIVAYCDVSGSVASYSKIMLKLISELDTSKYDLELYTWASRVSPQIDCSGGCISYKETGHGTNINAVFRHFDKVLDRSVEPDGVIVLTDGDYNNIKDRSEDFFKEWIFFMTDSSRHCTNHPSAAKSVVLNL